MNRYIKIAITVAQTLAVVGVLVWEKASHTETTLLLYVLPARHLLLSLNFPLVIIWWPIIKALAWLSGHYPLYLNQENGMLHTIGTVAAALVVFSSIAIFWYFTVAEIEIRTRGGSLFRFSSRMVELLKAMTFFLIGVATFFRIYTETLNSLHRGLAWHGLWPAEIFINALVLSAWGAAFVGASIADWRKLTIAEKLRGARLVGGAD